MKEQLVFNNTIESLLRALEQPLSTEQRAGLAALGINPDKPLLPAYPVETNIALIDFITRQRWPNLSREEAGFELGRAFMQGYMQTMIGKALHSVIRLIGPHRTLERMNRNFRSATNFTETRLQRLGPSTYELWFNQAMRPSYYRGLLTEGLQMAGAKEISVRLLDNTGDEATFHIAWTE